MIWDERGVPGIRAMDRVVAGLSAHGALERRSSCSQPPFCETADFAATRQFDREIRGHTARVCPMR